MKCESTLKMMKNKKKSKSKSLPVLEIINFNDFCCDVIKVPELELEPTQKCLMCI